MSRDFLRTLQPGQQFATPRVMFRLHLDPLLLLLLALVIGYGLVVLFSAVDRDLDDLGRQGSRILLAAAVMVAAAQVHPQVYLRWAPWVYGAGVVLLGMVLVMGDHAKGAQRWLELPGLPRFQPSEYMKLAMPMLVARYFADRELPPKGHHVLIAGALIAVPAALIFVQPDLGTAILVAAAGVWVVILAGLPLRWMLMGAGALVASLPVVWSMMREYQRERVLTLFDPERDPLGTGWNIIQSKTAIGSGGVLGKGLFNGTQSHLDFLPESHTDFIIAVLAEEFGFAGVVLLLVLYVLLIARGLYIAVNAQDAFGRLLAGSLTCTFFIYVFVNIAMVSGLLPVVGVPLPLVSHGGTSIVTLLAGFGILMSIQTHRRAF